jgi:hypothetical protein
MGAKRKGAGTIYIQLARDVSGVVEPQGDGERFGKLTREQLETVSSAARDTSNALMAKLKQFDTKPSKVALEFGISAGGEAGIPFVTKGTVEAQFKVSVEWSFAKGG